MKRSDVLIIGAGPTGLVLALWLTKLGANVQIIDKTTGPGTTSRALAVHARTLELYRQLDLAETIIQRGHKVPAANLWVKGQRETRVAFDDAGADLTPYPFLHIFPQDEHEQLLVETLQAMGVSVERQRELVSYEEQDDCVRASMRRPDGTQDIWEATYIAGCDGARSLVRQIMGTGFPGGTYQQLFYVADIKAAGPPMDGELHVDLDEADFLAVFPLAGDGRARLIGTVREKELVDAHTLKFEDINDRAISHLQVDVQAVNWFSTYHVHHRVTERFRKGRAFLLGDAAHIHSPAGGQGMNTGIGDAINLAWKLKAVLDRQAPDRLLDSYEAERIVFARKLVKTTDRAFTLATAEGRVADFIRTQIVPLVIPTIAGFDTWREWGFRTVSQLTLNYRDSPLSDGKAGKVHGGDRLPWVKMDDGDNHQALEAIKWQVHVYGTAAPDIVAWCEARKMPLHVFRWEEKFESIGLLRDSVYLLRPDSYVAYADEAGRAEKLKRYFDAQGIQL
jgi:2-polyprenyl-6-methoxyphenol hydroxylase-like FAD-dependent oxidoreductase